MKRFKNLSKHAIWPAIAVLAIWLAIISLHRQQIETVDLREIVTKFVKSHAKEHLSEAKRLAISKAFAEKLRRELSTYAANNDVVLMVKPAVVAGSATDVTQYIEYKLGQVTS